MIIHLFLHYVPGATWAEWCSLRFFSEVFNSEEEGGAPVLCSCVQWGGFKAGYGRTEK